MANTKVKVKSDIPHRAIDQKTFSQKVAENRGYKVHKPKK